MTAKRGGDVSGRGQVAITLTAICAVSIKSRGKGQT